MTDNLVIVESPAKARTLTRFLEDSYLVKASLGHVRDLPPRSLGVDIKNNFTPHYIITPDKRKAIAELKKYAERATTVWLASDEDREGEAISWHLIQVLGLEHAKVKRIVFHEITRTAINEAIKNPRAINLDLVNAQQARRVLDRLVGFELSPLLWRKVKPALSAGRVQSVAVRLIVEREDEIRKFTPESSYRITADLSTGKKEDSKIRAELNRIYSRNEQAAEFLKKCIDADFQVIAVETKPARKSPAPPFTTSTLQQEASRKLGFSVSKTMMLAQQLYESGFITYMRTDSVNLSSLALSKAKEVIIKTYGSSFSHTRKYTTRTKGAQEAHEAIRPAYLDQQDITGTRDQKKLYDLIWKRTIASQMSDALLEKTTVTISISTVRDNLIARGEVIKYEGFLKIYRESQDEASDSDEDVILPPLEQGQKLDLLEMVATERYSKPPYRYSEATLVKKLEELGIGRPSTYAPTISTIQKRNYVEKTDKTASRREIDKIVLKDGKIKSMSEEETYGGVKQRLLPTDIGIIVNDFLMEYFENIINYNFTADLEKEFDQIATGRKVWHSVVREFYEPFSKQVRQTFKESRRFSGERLLGVDPHTGQKVFVKVGRYGPMIQLGESNTAAKPKFAALKKGQNLDAITLEEALNLLQFPLELGKYNNAQVTIALGKYGPYIKYKNSFYSLEKNEDPGKVDLDRAIRLIEETDAENQKNILKEFPENPEIRILKGKWGPYLKFRNRNYRLPKDFDLKQATLEVCLHIVQNSKSTRRRKK
ncbi:MAG: type I DNA topoisomerase [Candidatus Cloacimonetes bacterium]|nr:type I DNA topoisomerase [Candidatus Cloacimonadota bacterium]